MATHPSLRVYQSKALNEAIRTDFTIETLDTACTFSEGPVWVPEGYYLFSDIPENKVCKIIPGHPKEEYLQPSGFTGTDASRLSDQPGSNGLALDAAGHLLLCQHGNGALARFDGQSLQPLVSMYNERRFNSPNDLIRHSDGTLYFSDPPYGLKDQQLVAEWSQPVAGLYCLRNGKVQLISDHFHYPNGVCLSPDEKTLYACSNKPFEREVLAFDADSLALRSVVALENGDGIECDPLGNLYLCAKEGIVIINSQGERLGVITFPSIPANACWGGPSGRDLFVTARESIFLIRELQQRQ